MVPFLQFAQPIEKLIPPFKDTFERQHYLDTEITRLTPIVSLFLREVGLFTTFYRTNIDSHGAPTSTKQESFDILIAYLHASPGSLDGQRMIRPLMTLLEEGIGTYLARQDNARREFFYPTVWLAYLIRLPITVLIRAGILPSGEFVANIYTKIIYYLIILGFALFAVRQGILTWKEAANYFFKHAAPSGRRLCAVQSLRFFQWETLTTG